MPAASILVRAKPARPGPARWQRLCPSYLALHAIVVIPLMTLLSVGAATLVGGHAHWIELPTQDWPGWLLVPLTIVAMDGANWLAHYASDDQAVNLGVVLTIWDILTGYARFPARGDSLTRTGLDGRPVPVEQDDPAQPAPVLAARQLIEPFRAQR